MPNSQTTLKPRPIRILGIDPGYERLGVAVIEKKKDGEDLLFSECFRTDAKLPFGDRLLHIGQRIESVIKEMSPEALAIENLFVSTNQKTAMRVGEVRGVILYLSEKAGLSVKEFTPLQVKIAITGYGKSEKKQVDHMVRRLIQINKKNILDDEIDAIAIALTLSATLH